MLRNIIQKLLYYKLNFWFGLYISNLQIIYLTYRMIKYSNGVIFHPVILVYNIFPPHYPSQCKTCKKVSMLSAAVRLRGFAVYAGFPSVSRPFRDRRYDGQFRLLLYISVSFLSLTALYSARLTEKHAHAAFPSGTKKANINIRKLKTASGCLV